MLHVSGLQITCAMRNVHVCYCTQPYAYLLITEESDTQMSDSIASQI